MLAEEIIVRLTSAAAAGLAKRVVPRSLRRLRAAASAIQVRTVTFAKSIQHRRLIRSAARENELVVVSRRGANPVRIVWDGAERVATYHYRDLTAYKRDTAAGRTPRDRSFCCGAAPRLGYRRTASAA